MLLLGSCSPLPVTYADDVRCLVRAWTHALHPETFALPVIYAGSFRQVVTCQSLCIFTKHRCCKT